MAQFIGDGYDETATLWGHQFEYRPLPSHDRWALAKRLAQATEPLRTGLIHFAIRERMITEVDTTEWELGKDGRLSVLLATVLGMDKERREQADEKNLRGGVRLLEVAPWMGKVSCQDCRTWAFDPLTGKFTEDIHGQRIPQEGPVLCQIDKCIAGDCDKGKDRRLSKKNVQCLRHYFECEATGNFPDDPLVARHAQIIRAARKNAERDYKFLQCPIPRQPSNT